MFAPFMLAIATFTMIPPLFTLVLRHVYPHSDTMSEETIT